MSQNEATARPMPQVVSPARIFTIELANRTLVYVRRIVEDIVQRYAELLRLREQRAELSLINPVPESSDALRVRIEALAEELNLLQEELAEVGCELKDWSTGLIDFPGEREGRRIWLCWKLGEPAITHWHEVDEGFSGRKPL